MNRAILKRRAGREPFLIFLLILLGILAVICPADIKDYPSFVEWQTIVALTGLLMITTGLKESGYFGSASEKILKRVKNERGLAIFFILLSAVLSTFLTNDITLFLVVPLTLTLQRLSRKSILKLVIFEAMAVNAGSALTPIGNPQNLFLWHQWGISFPSFMLRMLPLTVHLLLFLLIFAWFSFPDQKIARSPGSATREKPRKTLFLLSLILLLVYLISLELRLALWALPVIFILYLLFFRKVLRRTDWLLLLTFILIFIDFHILSTLPAITAWIGDMDLNIPAHVFLLSSGASQVISNVPASVFVSKFSHDWPAITYGVNVAGNGLVIASLANIIALRLARIRGGFSCPDTGTPGERIAARETQRKAFS